jgi:phosphohistidine phosphatase
MPKLFLIRHAIAEDREDFKKSGLPDDRRPLTEVGRKKMHKVASKLFLLEPDIQVFYQSPLVRSQQTVDVLKKHFSKASTDTLSSLSPGSPMEALLKDLQSHLQGESALIGHESHISQFLTYLLTGKTQPNPFLFKKGGIACLEYKKIQAGQFKLKWFVTPKLFLAPH